MKISETGILTEADLKCKKYMLLRIIMSIIMAVFCVTSLLPVVWIALSGFKGVQEIYSLPVKFFPDEIDFRKLAKVWNEMKFYKYYASTFYMAAGATVITCVVCGLGGYSLSKLKPIGTKVIFTILFWIMLMPGTMRTVPLYMEFKKFPIGGFSMLNSYLPIWIMAASSIFNIILFKNFFDGISSSIMEAARIDGAGDMRIFVSIVLPLSIPVFMTVSIFTFNGTMGQFFWPYLLINKKELTVLGVQLYNLKFSNYTMDYQMLAILFSILPQLIIFAIFQKQIIGGVNIGGVKG